MSDLAKVNRDKAKSQGFSALGIPIGSTLVFKKDPAITVKTLDDKNKVEYLGKPYSISTLAKQLVGSPVSGYLYFKFEGKTLKSLVKNEVKPVIPESPESAESSVPVPTEKAVKTPDTSGEPAEEKAPSEFGQDIDPLAGETEGDSADSAPNEVEAEIGA